MLKIIDKSVLLFFFFVTLFTTRVLCQDIFISKNTRNSIEIFRYNYKNISFEKQLDIYVDTNKYNYSEYNIGKFINNVFVYELNYKKLGNSCGDRYYVNLKTLRIYKTSFCKNYPLPFLNEKDIFFLKDSLFITYSLWNIEKLRPIKDRIYIYSNLNHDILDVEELSLTIDYENIVYFENKIYLSFKDNNRLIIFENYLENPNRKFENYVSDSLVIKSFPYYKKIITKSENKKIDSILQDWFSTEYDLADYSSFKDSILLAVKSQSDIKFIYYNGMNHFLEFPDKLNLASLYRYVKIGDGIGLLVYDSHFINIYKLEGSSFIHIYSIEAYYNTTGFYLYTGFSENQ